MIAQRYQLEREVARGGMGTVWLARDLKLNRPVAVKVMAQELAQMSEALQRFEREATAVAGLRSAHVVEVYDYGVQQGLPFIVMEMLEGENLGQRLKRLRRLDLADTDRIIGEVCKGLKAAHDAALIHRDLKPSNIFIARRDDTEVVKLLDFGVVKALDPTTRSSEATQTGILLGTPQYMSPEQARATKEIDHRSDLWSVAVITFRMLTGDNPFHGDSVGDVVLKICSDALPRISDSRQDLPAALDAFFDRAFKRDPNQRFQAAMDIADAFHTIATGAGTRPVPPPRAPLISYPSAPPRRSVPAEHATAPLGAVTPNPRPAFASSAPSLPQAPPSLPPAAASAPSLTPQPLASVSGSLPGMLRSSTEQTPISTTVGGTQLAPKLSAAPVGMAGRHAGLIVGGAAGLITLALVAAVWVGSGDDETVPAAAASSSPLMDYASNDDDGPGEALPLPPEPTEPVEPEAVPDTTASQTPAASTAAKPRPAPEPDIPAPLPRPPVDPEPQPRPDPDRPDW